MKLCQWEYKIEISGPHRDHHLCLGQLGLQGWELTSASISSGGDHVYFFKRPIFDEDLIVGLKEVFTIRAEEQRAADEADRIETERTSAIQAENSRLREAKLAVAQKKRVAQIMAERASTEEDPGEADEP